MNKANYVASKAVTQLGTEDQNHPVDSNNGMEKEIQSENDTVKDDNFTLHDKILLLNDSSQENQDKIESEVIEYDYELPGICR